MSLCKLQQQQQQIKNAIQKLLCSPTNMYNCNEKQEEIVCVI